MFDALVETEMILPNLRFTMCGAAAFDMYQLDFGFYLFRDLASGEDAA